MSRDTEVYQRFCSHSKLPTSLQRGAIDTIDMHTAGEPLRIILSGFATNRSCIGIGLSEEIFRALRCDPEALDVGAQRASRYVWVYHHPS